MKSLFLTKKNGQATIELSVALVILFTLLFGSLKIFLWINERIVQRQVTYEDDPQHGGFYGRVAAGSTDPVSVTLTPSENTPEPSLAIPGERVPDESSYPKLHIFK